MLLPSVVFKVGKSDGITGMDHHMIAHIDPNMRDSFHFRPHGPMEKHQVSRSDILRIDFFTQRMQASGSAAARIIDTGMNEYP